MANEWDLIAVVNADGFCRTVSVTVADATAIPKGTLITMSSDPNTGLAHAAGTGEIPLGITLQEKVANDGTTRMALAIDGIWDVVAKGAIALGDTVMPGATANMVSVTPGGSLSVGNISRFMGICLETATDAERVLIRLKLG